MASGLSRRTPVDRPFWQHQLSRPSDLVGGGRSDRRDLCQPRPFAAVLPVDRPAAEHRGRQRRATSGLGRDRLTEGDLHLDRPAAVGSGFHRVLRAFQQESRRHDPARWQVLPVEQSHGFGAFVMEAVRSDQAISLPRIRFKGTGTSPETPT